MNVSSIKATKPQIHLFCPEKYNAYAAPGIRLLGDVSSVRPTRDVVYRVSQIDGSKIAVRLDYLEEPLLGKPCEIIIPPPKCDERPKFRFYDAFLTLLNKLNSGESDLINATNPSGFRHSA